MSYAILMYVTHIENMFSIGEKQKRKEYLLTTLTFWQEQVKRWHLCLGSKEAYHTLYWFVEKCEWCETWKEVIDPCWNHAD